MVSPVLTEAPWAGAYLVSEANGRRSRDVGILSNQTGAEVTFPAGLVLAKLSAGGSCVPYDNVGSDGSEVAAAILFGGVTVPAGGTRRVTLSSRACEVNASELQWDASVDAAGKTAGLADLLLLGIVAR